MPELPEVETIRRDLEKIVTGKEISQVKVLDPKAVQGNYSLNSIVGSALKSIDRRGKLLVLELDDERSILIHLKMTGQLIYCRGQEMIVGGHTFDKEDPVENVGGELPNKHTRVVFEFGSGENVFFNDMRRFGYIKLVSGEEKRKKFRELGPEPLSEEFERDSFQKDLKKRKTAVKKVLLDQKLVAGIGNIYADEALFRAGIRPERPSSGLTPEEVDSLYQNIKKVLREGVKYRGTTFDNYVDGRGKQGNFFRKLRVYGREGERCLNCGDVVKKIRLANRGTHYCPNCQK